MRTHQSNLKGTSGPLSLQLNRDTLHALPSSLGNGLTPRQFSAATPGHTKFPIEGWCAEGTLRRAEPLSRRSGRNVGGRGKGVQTVGRGTERPSRDPCLKDGEGPGRALSGKEGGASGWASSVGGAGRRVHQVRVKAMKLVRKHHCLYGEIQDSGSAWG